MQINKNNFKRKIYKEQQQKFTRSNGNNKLIIN